MILTMGNRPCELERAVRSALDQKDVDIEVIIVGNGTEVSDEWPPGARVLPLPENLGIPAGRNRGVNVSAGDIILFLDDDGWYESPLVAAYMADRFAADPALGVISFMVRDPQTNSCQRRHVPRLRAGNPARSSPVTTFLGGACAIRRTVFDKVGGFPENFFYAHEETDLAWRALDAGFSLWYDAAAVMCHPPTVPTRHVQFYRLNARNRVWLARRNLPWPLAAGYLFNWTVLTVLRERSPRALRAWFAGFAEGWRTEAGPRHPISWRTAWRMLRLGRPPVI